MRQHKYVPVQAHCLPACLVVQSDATTRKRTACDSPHCCLCYTSVSPVFVSPVLQLYRRDTTCPVQQKPGQHDNHSLPQSYRAVQHIHDSTCCSAYSLSVTHKHKALLLFEVCLSALLASTSRIPTGSSLKTLLFEKKYTLLLVTAAELVSAQHEQYQKERTRLTATHHTVSFKGVAKAARSNRGWARQA